VRNQRQGLLIDAGAMTTNDFAGAMTTNSPTP
jgi:hypothetical protein